MAVDPADAIVTPPLVLNNDPTVVNLLRLLIGADAVRVPRRRIRLVSILVRVNVNDTVC